MPPYDGPVDLGSAEPDEVSEDAQVVLDRLMTLDNGQIANVIQAASELKGSMQERIEAVWDEVHGNN